jgi:hypothetical protein
MNNEYIGEQIKTTLTGVVTIFSFQKYASGMQKENQTKYLGMSIEQVLNSRNLLNMTVTSFRSGSARVEASCMQRATTVNGHATNSRNVGSMLAELTTS